MVLQSRNVQNLNVQKQTAFVSVFDGERWQLAFLTRQLCDLRRNVDNSWREQERPS
jgi:hypothetical protein